MITMCERANKEANKRANKGANKWADSAKGLDKIVLEVQ